MAAATPSGAQFGVPVEQLPMGTYVNAIGKDVRTVYVSPQLEALLGWTLEDWAKDGFLETIIHADDREEVLARVDEFHRTGERFSVEYRLLGRDCRYRSVHDETVVVLDEQGRPSFLQGFVFDVTEHRRGEALIAAHRAVLELIARGAPLEHILGELRTRVGELVEGADLRVEVADSEASITPPSPDPWTVRLGSPAGEPLGVLTIALAKPREPEPHERRLIAAVANAASIALERDRDEQSLRAAEAKYRTLVERLPIGSYINSFGTRLRPLYVSPELEKMLGYSLEDWNATDFLPSIIHPDDRERVLEQVVRTHELAQVFAADYRLQAADGRWVWVHDETVPVLDDDGNRLFLQGFMLDITERKHLEEQLVHAQKLEAVGRLAGGIAHDFNNVLTAISGYAEFLLARLAVGDPRRPDAEEIVRAAERAAGLTRQLLAFSRRQVLQPRELDLNEVLGGLERILQRIAGDHVELSVDLGPDVVPVLADPGQIEQVIVNLVMNASDAMAGADGRLELSTRAVTLTDGERSLDLPAGRYAALRIADNGHGIDDQVRSHLFEPFFTTKEQGKGTGLGLASVYGTVKQSGGTVDVESQPGQGAAFTIYLPEADLEGDVAAAAGAPEAQGEGETILLVEDHELFRGLVREVLTRAGYRVLEADGGPSALKLLDEAGHIDLLLTDVVMPEMTGAELARRVRDRRPGIPVLFTSGYEDEVAAQVAAANPFIGKPFLPEALARAVRAAIHDA